MSTAPRRFGRTARSRCLGVFAAALSAYALTACAASGPGPPPPTLDEADRFFEAEVVTVGWDQLGHAPVVLLRELESSQVVPIWVGVAEARAIASALHEVEFPRPMTHDLMASLLGELGAELVSVRVHDLKDGTYYGLLELRGEGGTSRFVDTRPSDGIALALRTGAAIRVARKILEQQPDFQFLPPDEGEQVVRIAGLTVVAPTAALREELGLPDRPGVVVLRAVGPAADAGLQRGDLLLDVAGAVPESPVQLLDILRDAPAGRPLPLRYWRAGEEHETTLEVAPLLTPREGPEEVA